MIARKILLVVAMIVLSGGFGRAAELVGKWTSEFDSQIGPQKYAFEFKAVEGGKFTGKANYDHSMGKGENALSAITVNGDEVSFTEMLRFDGNEIAVTYKGKFVGAEVKLTRTVGDFAVEEIVLKRPPTAPPPAS